MSASTFQSIGYLLILCGLIAFTAAAIAFRQRQFAATRWASTQGMVVDVTSHAITPGNPYFFPVIEYTTLEGQTFRFEADLGSYPSTPSRGQKVAVLYDPANPQHARLNSVLARWFVPGALAGFGFISTVLGGLFLYLSQ